ncbi:hypothetical protein Glove_213g67 [Diversispora epigaea]|uniref:F-box domain-containing protein n=1 Tax=Diversispora epigaea TaxID=1348612 RepID=A0A397IHN0_9GLOM|nr:hypothetical protein Glove_213g67 [Diversispora epigaea]
MSINTIPSELFTEILCYIPLESVSSILRVNKEWNQEYKRIIYQDIHMIFEELIFKNMKSFEEFVYWTQVNYYLTIRNLINFGIAFNFNILIELHNIKNRLNIKVDKLIEERHEIDKLGEERYRITINDNWPDELLEKYRQNYYKFSFENNKCEYITMLLSELETIPRYQLEKYFDQCDC